MRLDKFFSDLKIFSRKECKAAVKRGRVAVNGETVGSSDFSLDEKNDLVFLDGEKIVYKKFIYVLLNKPSGFVSATEDGRDKTVIDLLPENLQKAGLFPCGRLDKDTVGLVLLTNDGASAHNALSPKKHVEKTYFFTAAEEYSDEDVSAIENGLTLADGYRTKPCKIERKDAFSGYITLTEGKYHEIKRLFGARGNRIIFLERISFAGLTLGDLKRGQWRYLTDEEEKLFV